MNRKLFVLVIGVLPALVLALAGGVAAEPRNAAEIEPNDTIAQAQANPTFWNTTPAQINAAGDVDFYRVTLYEGQRIYAAANAFCNEELEAGVGIYDAGGNLLAQNEDWPGHYVVLAFIAPADGDYFVRVVSGGPTYYTLWIVPLPDYEPDDPFAPVDIPFNSEIDSTLFAPHDMDAYRVHARPGDVFRMSLTIPALRSGDGRLYIEDAAHTFPYVGQTFLHEPGTATLTFVVPFESDYIIRIDNLGPQLCGVLNTDPYHLSIERASLHVGANKPGTVDGQVFTAGDILATDAAGQWQLVFDGSDVGLTAALRGFEFLGDDILMSLKTAQSLPGLGTVYPTDIVRFAPTQLGQNTAGVFSFYLRGTQVGLTTQGERIDAIAVLADGSLMVSTSGSGSVPKFGGGALGARNEDLLLFHPAGPMPAAGTWSKDYNVVPHLSKLSAKDLEGMTIADWYVDSGSGYAIHYVNALVALDKSYRYMAPLAGDYPRFTAGPGDLIPLTFDVDVDYGEGLWPPLMRATLGFPRVIDSLSIGPGWNN